MSRNADADHASPADLAACRATLRHGSKTFFAASLLLPAEVRGPAGSLYAFCRIADDLVDRDGGGAAALKALTERVRRVYADAPSDSPFDRALADVVRRHAIPRALLDALFEGFAWDAGAKRYATMTELRAYAARVAGTVGAMMTLLMGVRDPVALARACDLGVAMQLSNVARDVGEDARHGRLYLPLDLLAAAGVDADAFLARPSFTPALGRVVAAVLDEADALYARAEPGIAMLPASCRPGILAARLLYAAIGDEVRRNGLDSVGTRAVVPASRKAALVARVLPAIAALRAGEAQPPLAETAFLIDAVTAQAFAGPAARPRWWELRSRTIRALELLVDVESREARPGWRALAQRS